MDWQCTAAAGVSMNPHAAQPTSLPSMANSLWRNRELILQMTRREVVGRYKGSTLGLLWSFLTPVLMLIVYTFVFSVVFNARWGVSESETKAQFALVLFAGLIVHSLFSEVVNRSPGLILANSNFVKRVIFPLEILPVVSLCAALFHSLVSLLVLTVAFVATTGYLNWTAVLTPLVFLPLVVLTLGFAWIIASLGTFIRDIGQFIVIITTVMMFLAPVFYPVKSLPMEFRPLVQANPITFIIEQTREVLIWGHLPNFVGLALYMAVALAVAWLGYIWFQKTRKGFADVL